MLARAGAQSVLIDYRDGDPFAVSFLFAIHGEPVAFRLPADSDAILRVLLRNPKVPRARFTLEQAQRVAWRVAPDWLRAQLVLVEAEQARLADAMLSHAATPSSRRRAGRHCWLHCLTGGATYLHRAMGAWM